VALSWGTSDDPKDKDDPDKKSTGVKKTAVIKPTKLVILVEAKAEQTPEAVLKTLKRGAELTKCTYEGKPDIQATPAAFFRMLRRLDSEPDTDEITGKDKKGGKEKEEVRVTMRPSLDEANNWLVRVHYPEDGHLTKLDVGFGKEGKAKTRSYTPKNLDKDAEAPLVLTLARTYVLRLAKDKNVGKEDVPSTFAATVDRTKSKGDKKVTATGSVDSGPRYFMVTFVNFDGELEKLFDAIKDPKKVGNPVEDAKADERLSLVFASWHRRLPGSEEFDGFIHKPRFARLPNRNVVRVWILFPLTKAEAEKRLADYRKITDSEKLVRKIRDEMPVRGSDPVTVGASTKAKWIELPDASGKKPDGTPKLDYFSRDLPLQNFRDLQKMYPDAYRLVVYEFEPDGGPPDVGVEAIEVLDPVTKRGVYVFSQAVAGWSARLQRLTEEEAQKTKKPIKKKPDDLDN